MGIVTIALLLAEFYISVRNGSDRIITGTATLIAFFSQISFFIGYRFDPAVSCFSFSAAYIVQYPAFAGLMLAAFFGWHIRLIGSLAIPAGLILLAIIIYIFLYHSRIIVKYGLFTNQVSLVVTILLSYGLLFCINTAIGRICTGLQLAQVSRYMTLLIPIFLAVYFHLLSLKTTKLSVFVLAAYIAIASLGSLPLGIIKNVASITYDSKINWRSCYLQTYDIEICNRQTGFEIYPSDESLHVKLDYLRENHLNLFTDVP